MAADGSTTLQNRLEERRQLMLQAREKVFKVLIIDFWNLSGESFDNIEVAIPKQLRATHSSISRNPRFEHVQIDEQQRVLKYDLTPGEKEAFDTLKRHAAAAGKVDLEAMTPFFETLLIGSKSDLLIFGTFRKLGTDDDTFHGIVQVDAYLVVRNSVGEIENPRSLMFRQPIKGSLSKLSRNVATDANWESDPIQDLLNFGTMFPSDSERKLHSYIHEKVPGDRFQVVEQAFPEEFLHGQTCLLDDAKRKASALATQQLLKLQADNARSWNYRGLVEYCGKNKPKALFYFNKAAQLDRTFADAWYNAGSVELEGYFADNNDARLSKAGAALEEATKHDKGFAEAFAKRGLVKLAQKDEGGARADLLRARQKDRKNPDVDFGQCQLYRYEGRIRPAIEACKSAVKQDPHLDAAHTVLGDINRQQKHFRNAIDHYRDAVKVNPENIQAQIALSEVLAQEGRHREALETAITATKVRPNHSVPWALIGQNCEAIEDYRCALDGYEKAATIAPKWTDLQKSARRMQSKIAKGEGRASSFSGKRASRSTPP